MNAETPGKLSKFQRYRARKKASGLKEFRVWAKAWEGPAFEAEMARANTYFAALDESHWIAEFCDQALADIEGWEA